MRFRFIDDLRGIAAMAVALSHLVWLLPAPFPALEIGRIGVEIFFVISGFVMAYSLRDATVSRGFLLRFALRRSARLDPPYWAVIGLELIVLALWGTSLPSWRVISLNAIYLQELVSTYPIVNVAWTLCLELQFYLVLALLLGLRQTLQAKLPMLGGRWTDLLAFGVPAIASVAFGIAWPLDAIAGVSVWATFLPYWFLFFSGVLVKWVIVDGRSPLLLVAYQGAILASVVFNNDQGLFPVDNVSPVFGVMVVATLFTAGRGQFLQRGFGNGVVSYFGRISYSLYLVHVAVGVNLIYLAEKWYGTRAAIQLPAFVIALLASIGAAHLLYVLVEAPSVGLAKRIRTEPSVSESSESGDFSRPS